MPLQNSVYQANNRLTNIANQLSGKFGFIAQEVAPNLDVEKQSNQIYRIDSSFDFERDEDDLRAPGSLARAVDFDVTAPTSYTCVDHRLTHAIEIETLANMEVAVKAAYDPVRFLTHRIRTREEINLVTQLATDITSTSTPGTKWNAAGGTPLTDIRAQIDTIMDSTGILPNLLAMDYKVFQGIVTSAEFISEAGALIGGVNDLGGFEARKRALADVLNMPNATIAVAQEGAIKNTAKKGQTKSISRIWGENVLLGRRTETTGNNYQYDGTIVTATWKNPELNERVLGDMIEDNFSVHMKYDDDVFAWVYKVGKYYDQVTMNADTGHWFTNTLA